MESLRLSFNAIAPIFLLMLIGYVIKGIKLVDKKVFDGINKIVFKIFLPTLLFYNLYSTKTAEIFNLRLIAFAILGTLLVFFAGYFLVMHIAKENPKRGVILQAIFRSNYAILGIPLVEYICNGASSGLSSLMVAFVVPCFNVLAVVALVRFGGEKVSSKKLLKGIITNPLIIGCVLGMICLVLHIKFPPIIEKTVIDVSKIATPLAIIVLGASFSFKSIKGYVREILIAVSARLVFVPLIAITAAALLGFRGEELACLLVTFGSPVAVSSFAMAQQMGGDETLAGHVVVISSAFCLLTLFVWIFVLSALGLF